MKISRYFTLRQLRGLERAGDVLVPGTGSSPCFSSTGCLDHIDRLAAYLNADDLDGLRIVGSLFAWWPRWAIRLLFGLCAYRERVPGPPGGGLRLLEIGVKGAVMSLYYANVTGEAYDGPKVFDIIDWHPKIILRDNDRPPAAAPSPPIAFQDSTPAGIAQIFEQARQARREIVDWPLEKRLEIIAKLKAVIIDRQALILDRIQQETGKSRIDALTAEIFGTLDHLDYLGKQSRRVLADRKVPTPLALMGKKSRIYFEPLGTALIISPWNYPFYQAIVPITLAFAVGNAVVYKPSHLTPLAGLVEELLAAADFRPGWVQVVYGRGAEVGDALIGARPDKIFFIGSARTGQQIMQRAARHLIPVELEMGGKDPMIVFEDADIERAAAGAVWGAFTNTGQSCTSVEKVLVHESIAEAFTAAVVRRTRQLIQATDHDGRADIGPMTSPAQVKVVAAQIADAKAKGARLLTGTEWDGQSALVPPMVVVGVTPQMLLEQEETFGPVMPIATFNADQEAVDLANTGPFGLSASVWSADLARAERAARAIVTGNVSINNVMLTEGNHALPFGGAKKSGIGRYKGEFGFYCFANIKSILIDANSAKMEANWFPYTPRKLDLFTRLTTGLYSPGWFSLVKGMVAGLKLEMYTKRLKRREE